MRLRAGLPWVLGALAAWLAAGGCGPEIVVERFQVTVAMVERCSAHSTSDETCSDPDPTTTTLPLVIETTDRSTLTLYATDPGDGTDRAYAGHRTGDAITASRGTRNESDAGCIYTVNDELALTIAGDQISGSQRRVSDEAGACNALGLRTVERTDWSWRGARAAE